MTDDLRQRACKAFTPEFRVALADACQTSKRKISNEDGCCPEGALHGICDNPLPRYMAQWCGVHGYEVVANADLHDSFQKAFDVGRDDGSPEAALGLLYRRRYP